MSEKGSKKKDLYSDRIIFYGKLLSELKIKKNNPDYWISALISTIGLKSSLRAMRKANYKGRFSNVPRSYTDKDPDLKDFLEKSDRSIKTDKELDLSRYFKIINSEKTTALSDLILRSIHLYNKAQNNDDDIEYKKSRIDKLLKSLLDDSDSELQ